MMDSNPSIFDKIGQFVVDKRNIIFILYTFAVIFCYFSLGWVKVEEDIVNYLPEDGKTRQGIAIMKEEFTTFATAQLMVSRYPFPGLRI